MAREGHTSFPHHHDHADQLDRCFLCGLRDEASEVKTQIKFLIQFPPHFHFQLRLFTAAIAAKYLQVSIQPKTFEIEQVAEKLDKAIYEYMPF